MNRISIIVPVYHGQKYIEDMIRQVEACTVVGADRCMLELIFVNDDPAELVDEHWRKNGSGKLEIKILETKINRGIHGARVWGLEHCKSEYVLFLDQDDKIEPDYFISQLGHLKDKDAVVCKLLHEGRPFYDTRMPFENVINKEYILSVRNPIISPGQVLIRRDRIPATWRNTKLYHNGADDWLLWLCMMGENREFAMNPETLFEHVVEGHNESMNIRHMMDSEQEIYEVVAKNRIFSEKELEKLQGAVRQAANGHLEILCKFQKMFFVYDDWMKLQEQGIYPSSFLKEINICSVAIYGDSYLGKRLYHSLKENEIKVLYYIDINAEYLEEEIPVYRPDEQLPAVDMIIISLVDYVKEIKKNLSGLLQTEIIGITDLFERIKIRCAQ